MVITIITLYFAELFISHKVVITFNVFFQILTIVFQISKIDLNFNLGLTKIVWHRSDIAEVVIVGKFTKAVKLFEQLIEFFNSYWYTTVFGVRDLHMLLIIDSDDKRKILIEKYTSARWPVLADQARNSLIIHVINCALNDVGISIVSFALIVKFVESSLQRSLQLSGRLANNFSNLDSLLFSNSCWKRIAFKISSHSKSHTFNQIIIFLVKLKIFKFILSSHVLSSFSLIFLRFVLIKLEWFGKLELHMLKIFQIKLKELSIGTLRSCHHVSNAETLTVIHYAWEHRIIE